MSVLKVRDLKKTFSKGLFRKRTEVLKGLDFTIEEGSITGFLGSNGAGKTTTIKCLLNLVFPDSGEITYFGQKHFSTEIKGRIGFLPERPYFYEYLTGKEFLHFYASISQRIPKNKIHQKVSELIERVGFSHAGDRQLRHYSKGMLQRVGIAQALIHGPELVILDEPMSGLDPDGRLEVESLIREVSKSGTAVFFSSHLLRDMELLCDRLVIMKSGTTVYEGKTLDLLNRTQQGYKIAFQDGATIKSEEFAQIEAVQKRIDDVRRQGASILEVSLMRPTLEEVFIQMAKGEAP